MVDNESQVNVSMLEASLWRSVAPPWGVPCVCFSIVMQFDSNVR